MNSMKQKKLREIKERNKNVLKLAMAKVTYVEIAEAHAISLCTVSRILSQQGFVFKKKKYDKDLRESSALYYDTHDLSFVKVAAKFDVPVHVVRTAHRKLLAATGRIQYDARTGARDVDLDDDESLGIVKRVGLFFHKSLLNLDAEHAITRIEKKFNLEHDVAKKLYRDRRSTYVGSNCHARRPHSPMKSIAALCI